MPKYNDDNIEKKPVTGDLVIISKSRHNWNSEMDALVGKVLRLTRFSRDYDSDLEEDKNYPLTNKERNVLESFHWHYNNCHFEKFDKKHLKIKIKF